MHYLYRTKETCAYEIEFDLEDGKVNNIKFNGGCNGNLKMLSKLLSGKSANEIIESCSGNICGRKSTSCADQLAQAVKKALAQG